MADQPSPTEHPLVTRIKSGQVPDAAKLSAAKGLLPIPAEDLVGLMVFLTRDASSEVRATARTTLQEYPEDQLKPVLGSEACAVEVLDHFARNPRGDALSEIVLLNPGTPDEGIEQLAATISPKLMETLIRNEVRLIRHPAILDRIEANPTVSPAVVKRAEEIRKDFIAKQVSVARPVIEKAPERAIEKAPAEEAAAAGAMTPEVADAAAAERAALDAPATKALTEALELEKREEEDPELAKKQSLEQRIMKLTIPEKIKLAHLGGRQSRMILIKDPNRTVSNAVLNGGKISQQEIELLVQFRNIDDEILRRIAATKQWMKVYTIVHNLIKNPRTPLGITSSLIGRLALPDLKRLENNNNVSGMVREQAKRFARLAQEQRSK